MSRLFRHIVWHLGALEQEYREAHLGFDKAQIIIVAIIAVIINITMLRSDSVLFASHPALYSWMIGYRGIYSVISLLFILVGTNLHGYRKFDQAAFIWALITAIYLLLFKYIPLVSYYTNPFDILYPFGIYLLLQGRLSVSLALAVSYSVGVIVLSSLNPTSAPYTDIPTVMNSQILAHVLALPSAIQIQSYRRRSFKAYLDQKDAHDMARYLINIDTLTKSMTHLYFMDVAFEEFLRARRYNLPLSLMVMDLDHFKRINDKYGHAAGDQVLQRFAEVVLEQKRVQDVFARLGGEEFGLLLPSTSLMKAKALGERIQQRWADITIMAVDNPIQSTVSIGVAELDPKDTSFEMLLHRADSIMYKAKRRGRNRVAFK